MVWISFTGVDTYLRCPQQYKLHYKDKIRPVNISSALHFGTALDAAINAILLNKKKNPTKEELEESKQNPIDIFETKWFMPPNEETVLVSNENDVKVPVGVCSSICFEYYKSDFDESLLDEADFKRLRDFIKNAGYQRSEEDKSRPEPLELFNELREVVDDAGKQANPNEVLKNPTDLSYYNFCCWLSMRQKGLLLVQSFLKDIYPLIDEVKSVQKEVKLPNAAGDRYVGKLDFELSFKDEPGVFYTTDFKTSSMSKKYKLSDINDKGQIASYDVFAGNNKGAYIVQYKQIQNARICEKCETVCENNRVKTCKEEVNGKKCNGKFKKDLLKYVKFDILRDDIQYETKERVFEQIDRVLKDVKTGIFHQNRDECFQFGKKCPYYYYCRSEEYNRDIKTIPLEKVKKGKK